MTPLVLLPGSLCDARVFAPQIEALAGERSVSVGDLTRDDSIDAMAERVLKAAPARFALGGLSLGGIVAMAVVARAPERVERLALLDTNHRDERPERRARRQAEIDSVAREGLIAFFLREVFPWFPAADAAPERIESLRGITTAMADACGPAVFGRQWIALRDRADHTEALRRYRGPTLVLCGDGDRLCPPSRHAEMTTLIENAAWVTIPDAGHLPTLDQPESVTAALRSWLHRAPARQAVEKEHSRAS